MNEWDTKNAYDNGKHGSAARLLNSTGQKITLVHINKTAGTSIGRAIGTSFPDKPNQIFHASAYQLKLLLGDSNFDDIYKFAVARNPYDRFLSMYRYRTRTKQPGFENKIPSLEDFFYEAFVGKLPKYRHSGVVMGVSYLFMNQHDWICDPLNKEKILVDRVLSFEKLQEDFDLLADFLKQPRIKLPLIKAANKKEDFIDHFKSPTFISDFNQYYNQDFEYFKYDKM